ncbi:MAG: DUF2752 domain-containing protein [Bacteroidales bacterium]|nr:DUF2752 domain-containing protein [Bacteroidales bacterium]
MQKKFTILIAVAAIIFVAAMAFVYFKYNPLESNMFPKCGFYVITGWKCPGCGSQRALHFLLHGQFAESFRQNPLLWVGGIYIAVTQLMRLRWFGPRCEQLRLSLTGLWASVFWLVAIIAYWVLRNVF